MDFWSYDTLLTLTLIAASLFVFVIGTLIILVAVMFIIDVSQTKHAIRRNYPVIGRFRYLFERLGEFFRQYFFALDREEMLTPQGGVASR